MATFIFTDPDTQTKYKITGDDEAGATEAFKQHLVENPPQPKGYQYGRAFEPGPVPFAPGVMNSAAREEIANQFREGIGTARDAFFNRGTAGPIEGPVSTLRGLGGLAQAAMSPVMGPILSAGGHTMADLAHLAGTYINPQVAARETPQEGYEWGKGAINTALMAAAPEAAGPEVAAGIPGVRMPGFRGGSLRDLPDIQPPPAPAPAPPVPGEPVPPLIPSANPIVAARDRLAGQGIDVNVSRGLAGGPDVQQVAKVASNVPIFGAPLRKSFVQTAEDIGKGTAKVASDLGEGTPETVGGRIRGTIETAADTEAQAAKQAQMESDTAIQTAADKANADRLAQIGETEQQAALSAQQQVGSNVAPQDLGQTAIDNIRREHDAAENLKNNLYAEAGKKKASITPQAAQSAVGDVAQGLRQEGRVVNIDRPQLTPAASEMMDEITRFSNEARAGQPVSVQDIEQLRKTLNQSRGKATLPADQAAAESVMGHFDDWHGNAMQNSMTPGSDPTAYPAYLKARAANTDFRGRFGYNARGSDTPDADRLIKKIVTQDVQPEEVAGQLLKGDGRSSRLIDRATQATGNSPDFQAALRGAVYRKLAGGPEEGAAIAPAKVAKNIHGYLNENADHAARVFPSAQDQMALRGHANAITDAAAAREEVAATAKATAPSPTRPAAGPAQDLQRNIIGGGRQSNEQLFNAVEGMARSGSRADLSNLTRLVKSLPADQRGDLASALIRKIGQGADGFSVDRFVSEWSGKGGYTPEAKSLLFGDGTHRQALDDIATIAARHKDVARKYGNPSGTGQTYAFVEIAKKVGEVAAHIVAGTLHPLLAVASTVGPYGLSKILAAPAGSASLARWIKVASAVQKTGPTAGGLAAYSLASRNLSNTAQGLGVDASRLINPMSAPQR